MWLALIIWILLGVLLALIVELLVWPSRYSLAENIVAGLVGATLLGLLGSQFGATGTGLYWWAAIGSLMALAFLRWFGQNTEFILPNSRQTAKPSAPPVEESTPVPDTHSEPDEPVEETVPETTSEMNAVVVEAAPATITEPSAAEAPVTAATEAAPTAESPTPTAVANNTAADNTNYPDDLTAIRGIGKVYERKLYEAGIYTYAQIAQTDVTLLDRYANAIEAANVSDWPRQASELAVKHGRENASYHGPLPDKFAILPTLSEATEQRLYRAGILTYEQLATATPDTLLGLLPKSLQSGQVNVNDWIVAAKKKLTE